MRIRSEGNLHAHVHCQAADVIIDVEPRRVRLELDVAIALLGGLQDAFEVYPARSPSSRPVGCAKNIEIGIVHGADHSLGLLGLLKVELVVDRAHPEIEVAQDRVWQIEGTVCKDVELDAF
jgi:hypothetical protein